MQKKLSVNRVTKLSVDILFYVGIAVTVAVPFIAANFQDLISLPLAVMLVLSGICAVVFMFTLKQMFRTLLGGNPFALENIRGFEHMSVCCFLIAAIYVVKCVLAFSWATVVIVIIFTVGALFCLTLRNIFEAAKQYKEENDLTV